LRPDLPPALCRVVMRCLAKRPDDRWQTAAALAQEVEPFLLPSGAVTPVQTTAIRTGRGRFGPRHLALVAALARAVGLGGYWCGAGEPAITLGAPRRIGTGPDLELDPTLGPDGKLIAFSAGSNGSLRIFVRQVGGGDPVAIASDVGGNQRNPVWSP